MYSQASSEVSTACFETRAKMLTFCFHVQAQVDNLVPESLVAAEMHVKIEDMDSASLEVQPSVSQSPDGQGPTHLENIDDRTTGNDPGTHLELDACFDEVDYR